MQKWEYCLLQFFGAGLVGGGFLITEEGRKKVSKADSIGVDTVRYLNQMGEEGWEVAGYVSVGASQYWTLKRPKD